MKYHIETQFNSRIHAFLESENASFLQTEMWFTFQKELGRTVHHIYISDNEETIASCIVITLPLFFGRNYVYAPHGPIIKDNQALELFKNAIKELAKKENAVFFHADPEKTEGLQVFKEAEFTSSNKERQPRETVTLDITPEEGKILKSFHSKTRYNIRLSKRKGVNIRIAEDIKDISIFYDLAITTKTRNTFGIHEKEYYKKQLEILQKTKKGELFIAEYDGKPIAANICVFNEHKGIYLHGASSNEFRNVMAPHLLQWEQILHAKKLGCTVYDFWGATTSEDKNHPWFGVTRFKKGFSKKFVSYIPTQELVTNKPWYTIYTLASKLRK